MAKAFVYTLSMVIYSSNSKATIVVIPYLVIVDMHIPLSQHKNKDRGLLGSYNDMRSAVVLICMYSVLCRRCVLDASLPGHILRIDETS